MPTARPCAGPCPSPPRRSTVPTSATPAPGEGHRPRGGYTGDRPDLPAVLDGGRPGTAAAAQGGMDLAAVDTPQQGACPKTLATTRLAGAWPPTAGCRRCSTRADLGLRTTLTWDIDPALLSDATVMTRAYFTGGNAECTGRTTREAEPGGQRVAVQAGGPHCRPARLPHPVRQRGRGRAQPCRARREIRPPPTSSAARWPARYCRARSGRIATAPATARR